MTKDGHISDDDLERLILGTITDEAELAPLEEHLLLCAECIERAEQTRQYVGTTKAALTANRRLGGRKAKAESKERWLVPG
jgi:hypothetical protein